MPELPEVETIRRGLLVIRHKRIKKVIMTAAKNIKPKNLAAVLKGVRIIDIDRRGKLLIFYLSNHDILLIHLKMTGQLVYQPSKGRLVVGGHPIESVLLVPNKFTCVTLIFENNSQLYFNDVRKFGYFRLIKPEDLKDIIAGFGPEPLDSKLTKEVWLDLVSKKSI